MTSNRAATGRLTTLLRHVAADNLHEGGAPPAKTLPGAQSASSAAGTDAAYDWEAHQKSIPRLPIPALWDTCSRFLEYTQPLLTKDEQQLTRRVLQASE